MKLTGVRCLPQKEGLGWAENLVGEGGEGEGGEGEGGMGAKGTPGRGSCPALQAFCSLQYINTQMILFRAVHTVKHLSVK